MIEDVSTEAVQSVLDALTSPDFKWRTVEGVAHETGLTQEIVHQAISEASDKIVRSSVPSSDGRELYATREHFREFASLSEKLLGAIKNRVI